MSYMNKIEGMISGHYGEYEDEVMLAQKLRDLFKHARPSMPFDYPQSVYHPRQFREFPHARHISKQLGGKLSNGVPKVLQTEIVDGYLLGVYNPKIH